MGVEGDQLVVIAFADLEGDGILPCKQGFFDGGLDIQADGSRVSAAKAFYRVQEARIAWVVDFVDCPGRVERQDGVIDEIHIGGGVPGGLCYVHFQMGASHFVGPVDGGKVEFDEVFVKLVVVRVGLVFSDDLDVVKSQPVLPDAVVLDIVRNKLDVACAAGAQISQHVGIVGNEPAIG